MQHQTYIQCTWLNIFVLETSRMQQNAVELGPKAWAVIQISKLKGNWMQYKECPSSFVGPHSLLELSSGLIGHSHYCIYCGRQMRLIQQSGFNHTVPAYSPWWGKALSLLSLVKGLVCSWLYLLGEDVILSFLLTADYYTELCFYNCFLQLLLTAVCYNCFL